MHTLRKQRRHCTARKDSHHHLVQLPGPVYVKIVNGRMAEPSDGKNRALPLIDRIVGAVPRSSVEALISKALG